MTDEYQRLLNTMAAIVERYHREPHTVQGGRPALRVLCERYGPVRPATGADQIMGIPMLADEALPPDVVEIRNAAGEVLHRFLVDGAS